LTLAALCRAVAIVAPWRLTEFFEDMQATFVRAADEDGVLPIRHFRLRWGVTVEIERHPATARRLHAAEQAVNDADPETGRQAIREVGEIVRAAFRQVDVGGSYWMS
jgi:hypothetical protein